MIIGISGYARSGKNATAGMLVGLHGYEARAFAEPIKTALLTLNPILESGFRLNELVKDYGWEVAKSKLEVRRLLQVFGTEIGRNMFGQDFWVDQAIKGLNSTDKIVFADCRFPNEADKIKQLGGDVWRITRPGVEAINSHPSEHALDSWAFDRVITNDGDLQDLKFKVSVAVSDL